MENRGDAGPTPRGSGPAPRPPRTVLVVGAPPRPGYPGLAAARGRIVTVALDRLDASRLAAVLPDCVLTWLVAGGVDAMEVAERLQALGYGGELWVVCPPLPDLPLVRRELACAFPGLAVRFLTETGDPG